MRQRIEHRNIRYYKNETNLGYDYNVNKLFKVALGKYVWIVGDDDLLDLGAVNYVLEIIRKYKGLSFIYVNFSMFSRNNNSVVNKKYTSLREDVHFDTADEFLGRIKTDSNFISTNIFKKSLWDSNLNEKYFGSAWIHFGVMLDIIQEGNLYAVSHPYVINCGERDPDESFANSGGASLKIILTLLDLVLRNKHNFTNKTIKKLQRNILRYLPKKINSSLRNGLKIDWKIRGEVINRFYKYPIFWVISFPLMLTPKLIHHGFYKVIWFLRKKIIWNRGGK